MRRHGTPVVEGEIIDLGEAQVEARESIGSQLVKGTVPVVGKAMAGSILAFTKPSRLLERSLMRVPNMPQQPIIHTHGIFIVQRVDGTKMQARIEGELISAILSRGDVVSLWGKTKAGVLFVNCGFNHTVSAEIKIRRR